MTQIIIHCGVRNGLDLHREWYGKLTRGGVGRVRFVGLAEVVCFITVLFCSVWPKIYISNTSLQERERKTFLGNTRIDVIPIYIRRTMPHYLHSPGRGLLFIPK